MADKKYVMSNVTINFSLSKADGDLYLDVEVNEDDNGGKTTFSPGDSVKIRVFTNAGSLTAVSSSGVLTKGNNKIARIEDDFMVFPYPAILETVGMSINEATANSQRIPAGGLSTTWVSGGAGGPINLAGTTTFQLTSWGVGVCRASYDTSYTEYTLSDVSIPVGWPAGEDYPVVVAMVGV